MIHLRRQHPRLLMAAALVLGLLLLWTLLQYVLPHLQAPFSPDYPQVDLTPILQQPTLSREDYQTLYLQTGLAPAAIDDLRAAGALGQIVDSQTALFHDTRRMACTPLGITTMEHRLWDDQGRLACTTPLAPLREGDVLVALSTHTAGWTHGHAGLVLDPIEGVTLESVVLGTRSVQNSIIHWQSYSTLIVLRPKADDALRHQVVDLALERLLDVPYSLTCGVFGPKLQPLEGGHTAHCSYLPWYAWAALGVDLDSDGGRVVSPIDLCLSDQAEVVQVYGVDPRQFPLSFDD